MLPDRFYVNRYGFFEGGSPRRNLVKSVARLAGGFLQTLKDLPPKGWLLKPGYRPIPAISGDSPRHWSRMA